LPWRRVHERHDEGSGPNDSAQHAGDGFRVHPGIPWLPWRPQAILPLAAPQGIATSPPPCA
jgi:hypothetical protein